MTITKRDWLDAITKEEKRGRAISKVRDHLEAPQFSYGNWYIGTEKVRDFKTLVFRWQGPGKPARDVPEEFRGPPSYQRKNWPWRKTVSPSELRGFLDWLDGLAADEGSEQQASFPAEPTRPGTGKGEAEGGDTAALVELFERDVSATARDALISSRLGQGGFRESLIALWSGMCAVTGLSNKELLVASHIKPWRDASDQERLDPYNGLLLSPGYDKLFDAGWITFGGNGLIMLSYRVDASVVNAMCIRRDAKILGLTSKHVLYLAYHREKVFLGTSRTG
jgi:hypothetical protein